MEENSQSDSKQDPKRESPTVLEGDPKSESPTDSKRSHQRFWKGVTNGFEGSHQRIQKGFGFKKGILKRESRSDSKSDSKGDYGD